MNPNDTQTALNLLLKMKESLVESMVEELLRHQEEDPSSFSLQEIEDRFAIRVANLNTLIATLQDQTGQSESNPARIVIDIEESTRQKLESRLNEILEFIAPDQLAHLSIIPLANGKFIIVTGHNSQ